MADIETKAPTKTAEKPTEQVPAPEVRRPFDCVRREADRLIEGFEAGFWRFPSRSGVGVSCVPAGITPVWLASMTDTACSCAVT